MRIGMENMKKKNMIIGMIMAVIILVIVILLFIFVFKKDRLTSIEKVNAALINKENMVLYIGSSKNCSYCKNVSKYLDKNKIDYTYYDISKDTKSNYEKLLHSLSINKNDFGYPAIIYIKDGEQYSNIININSEKVIKDFLKNSSISSK